ncbi:DNA-directed primase/polymerase protein [Calliopsis andreniformis]|uniref:DNA-directed primase/polymerase protein n=1 Tax=Calliopsis andreniformis TaxID=337506 RepID=UPI003FCEB225
MNTIKTSQFYNRELIEKEMAEKKKLNSEQWVRESRRMPSHILGPREFWMEFDKQADALAMTFKESNDFDTLCTFVYQRDNGYRKFVVAHPEMYWWHYEHRPSEKRCSYEVIPENCPCRLYLDLEYLKELNPDSDGPSMTNTIIDIFNAYLLSHWGLLCNKYNVLNLDSSTSEKFSRHVIFNIKDVAFKDNYHVGKLVKSVCNDIVNYVLTKETQHNILSHFDKAKLEQLFILTKKDKRLFVDTGVYTKNRHFRIFKSTKWGKQSNLTVSEDCKYIPSNLQIDKELCIFLDSLVSYFITKKDLILLDYCKADTLQAKCFKKETQQYSYETDSTSNLQYPMLDKYIQKLIAPGKIRLCKYFESAKILVYETTGYRYCENIGRCHKSNNVFWIVDLRAKTVYQKCHDEDCFGFKSTPKQLPDEISFQIDEEDDMLLSCAVVTEDV